MIVKHVEYVTVYQKNRMRTSMLDIRNVLYGCIIWKKRRTYLMNEIKMSYYNFYVNRDDKIIIYNTKTGKACEYKKDLIQGLKDGAGN